MELPVYTVGVTDPHTASLATPVFGTDGRLLGALTDLRAAVTSDAEQRVQGMRDR